MQSAKTGDTVHVHYSGRLNNGEEFDSSRGREPLRFTLGAGDVIAGFDDAVTGMTVGEEKQITIPVDQAYGEHREDLVMRVGRDQFPEDYIPTVGEQVQLNAGGQSFVVTVTDVEGDRVTLDGNHPLAGEPLIFDLRLVDIE
jgi:peptidylprolyl isomerase